MKILHVVENFGGAGLENVVRDLVLGSICPEINPIVCVLNHHGYCGEIVEQRGVPVFDLDRQQMEKKDGQVVRELWALIKRLDVDVIHAHNFTALYYVILSAAFTGIRIVVTFHGFTDWNLKKWLFYNAVFSRIRVVIVNNAMERYYSFLRFFPLGRVKTVFNGIHLDLFGKNTSSDLRERLGLAPADLVIGSIGRLSPVKNQMLQLRALAALKEDFNTIKLLLITGESPDSTDLKKKMFNEAKRLGVDANLILLDFRKDVPDLLTIMDIFIMTSLTEGTSLALLEAMASGLPVVVSDVGGNKKIVTHGKNGFLYALDEEEKLVSILKRLILKSDLRHRIGKESLKTTSEYSTDRMVEQYLSLYLS